MCINGIWPSFLIIKLACRCPADELHQGVQPTVGCTFISTFLQLQVLATNVEGCSQEFTYTEAAAD